ncbi:hypothetical protein NicSoilE8_03370 [Arthrobacter sp. NicSoilE8]|nr:hypothetical protein NicSoilE8_03370 [Arthrobacter sp. NicSoilE8]
MEKHHMLVAGEVDIALKPVGAVRDRFQIRSPGVLGVSSAGPSMCIDLGTRRGEGFAAHADTVTYSAARTGLVWANAGEL